MNIKFLLPFLIMAFLTISCKNKLKTSEVTSYTTKYDFVISFGSCNNQNLKNNLWDDVLENNPNIWIWGGDIIYSDTEDMNYLSKNYQKQAADSSYAAFKNKTEILATWDDHDYGLNDGGTEYLKKKKSQQVFLDFLNADSDDIRRNREGIYYAKNYTINDKNINVIVLDSRYFRTSLTIDTKTKKRYKPNKYGNGTMLGDAQWEWLEKELSKKNSDYNIIVSSIQFLSSEHGYESWGNMPHEVDKLQNLIVNTKAKRVIILSGDRHISEFSKKYIKGLNYPLVDFTSSGLTHSYSGFKGEANKYRVGDVVFTKSFGILKFNLTNDEVLMEMRGDYNKILQAITQKY